MHHKKTLSVFAQYHEDTDVGFGSSLTCCLLLLTLLSAVQSIILPRTTILLVLFLTAFAWVAVVLMLLLAFRLRIILWDISQSFVLRLAITAFSIILIYAVGQVNVVSTLKKIKKLQPKEKKFLLY